MTTYREEDIASVDSSFGVQVHHPRFLECIGASTQMAAMGLWRPPGGQVDPVVLCALRGCPVSSEFRSNRTASDTDLC